MGFVWQNRCFLRLIGRFCIDICYCVKNNKNTLISIKNANNFFDDSTQGVEDFDYAFDDYSDDELMEVTPENVRMRKANLVKIR